MEHLKYAFGVARVNPMIFGPSLVEVLFAFMNQRILESWDVYNEFIDTIVDYFYSQMGVSPVSYVPMGFEFDYSRFISWVPVALLLLSLLSWLASLASIRVSWVAIRGEELLIQESFIYVMKRILRFVYTSIVMTVFFVATSVVGVAFLYFNESMGGGFAALVFLLVMFGMMVAAILTAPIFIVMVGEDEGFMPSLRKTIRFTRRSFWTYIGLGVLIALIVGALGFVPYVGYYIGILIGAVSNIAMIDLYIQEGTASEL